MMNLLVDHLGKDGADGPHIQRRAVLLRPLLCGGKEEAEEAGGEEGEEEESGKTNEGERTSNTSGARYHNVTTSWVYWGSGMEKARAKPKSAIFNSPVWSISRFCV
jgi:hypothetical protein